jgi:hypothetical protein
MSICDIITALYHSYSKAWTQTHKTMGLNTTLEYDISEEILDINDLLPVHHTPPQAIPFHVDAICFYLKQINTYRQQLSNYIIDNKINGPKYESQLKDKQRSKRETFYPPPENPIDFGLERLQVDCKIIRRNIQRNASRDWITQAQAQTLLDMFYTLFDNTVAFHKFIRKQSIPSPQHTRECFNNPISNLDYTTYQDIHPMHF